MGEGGQRRLLPPALVLVAAVAVVYVPLFLGRVLYQRDLSLWIHPAQAFVRAAARAGQEATWNPYVGLGVSTLGNPLYGLFYPPNLLHRLGSVPRAASLVLWLHLAFGGLGVLVLARRLGARPVAALVGGLAFCLSGLETSMWTFGIMLVAYAWLPWCAVGFVPLFSERGSRAGAVGWAAVPLGLALLSGEIFLATVSAGFALVVGLVHRRTEDAAGDGPAPRAVAAGVAGALALAAALGAVSVLPAARSASSTERRRPLPAAVAEQGSFHPLRLIELGAGGMTLRAFDRDPARVIQRLGGTQPLALDVYAGGSVLALALVALGRGRRRAAVLAALALLGFLISMGRYTPVHGLFRWVVLPLAYMRFPEKYLVVPFALLALLAARGADPVLTTGRPAEEGGAPPAARRTALLTAGLLLLAAVGRRLLPVELGPFVRAGALQGAAGAAAVMGVQLLAARRDRIAGPLLVAVVLVDLGAAALPALRWTSPEALETPPPVVASLGGAEAPLPPRLFRSPRIQRAGGDGQLGSVLTLRENTGVVFGVDTLPGYDAGLSPELSQVLELGRNEVLRLLAVAHALLPAGPGPRDRPGLQRVGSAAPGVTLYAVDGPLPRVYLAGSAEVRPDPEARARLLDPAVVDGGRVLVAPGPGATELVAPAGRAGACRWLAYTNTRLEATCTAERQALAVFVEQWAPGWRAFVDGQPAPLQRANLVMRAVAVPPGAHRIALRYLGPGLAAGEAVTAVAALVCLALIATAVIRRRPP